MTNDINISPAAGRVAPEFFPLPPRGPDPHFGISRSSWYDLESRGLIRLTRLRKPGNVRGRVLVPYVEALALFRGLSEKGQTT